MKQTTANQLKVFDRFKLRQRDGWMLCTRTASTQCARTHDAMLEVFTGLDLYPICLYPLDIIYIKE